MKKLLLILFSLLFFSTLFSQQPVTGKITDDKNNALPGASVQVKNTLRGTFSDIDGAFYYVLGNKIWGEYGFYDAFSEQYGWFPQKYLAIDEGPIIVMIENYRTGLLWNLFMSSEEIHEGLALLGFTTVK